jgi:hypothetical protein
VAAPAEQVKLLVSGATKTLRELNRPDRLGVLLTPDSGNAVPRDGTCFAADNAAFSNFSPSRFCTLLGRIAGKPGCRFVAAPDVVGNAQETAIRFSQWQPILRSLELPVALVLQDGQDLVGVPWDLIDAVFIGGSTEFKLGRLAASITREAKSRGKFCHMGRVNTRQRFRYAMEIGCDTADGSGFSMFPSTRIPMALRWLDEIERQPSLLAA